jgi:hypothetical protein
MTDASNTTMRLLALTLAAALLPSCGGDSGKTADTVAQAPTSTAPDSADMSQAARTIAAFLNGQAPIDTLLLADSVTLYVAPEGGGQKATLSRSALRERTGWAVRGSRSPISFVPDIGLTKLTTEVGRHFKCFPQDLASQAPQLATLPHVGIKMEPVPASSCLNTWNLTVVFDSASRKPRVVAALYDQWEW